MRTITLILVFIATMTCYSQNNLMETRNRLQRELQTAEATWMTAYNLAFTDIRMTFALKDDLMKSRLLDEAEGYLVRLDTLKGADISEVEALKAFRYLSLMNMNPSVNGPKYAAPMTVVLEKAKKLNPNNPRVIILSAMYHKNLAAFMGQEYEEYDKEIVRAKELLSVQDSTRLAPVWGMELCGMP